MKETWRIFCIYLLILSLVLFGGMAFGQSPCKKDVCVVEFNASWNSANGVDYLNDLTDCGIKKISIDEGDWQKKYNIVIVPTIIVFNGDEVKRFQADLSFKLLATKEEIQGVVDEIIMSDF
ncbi:MAG: hypothetical protein GOVbin1709_2 [Prokaryotic dsDNA virus sp.]|nr:MAG: hypothetical protein GOVbin1709_2 [Prokaryotic dsDNA virus sp.]|tara:strand:+ start:212 stop:574 length:363 start_codon:yes stop_codon:yes gene_type:complete